MNQRRLAVLTTHPIQYQAPWLRALAGQPDIELQVFFCHQATPMQQAAAGFGVEFDWDVPLLEGYSYRFLRNVAKRPMVAGFNGLDTPEIKRIIAAERFDAVLVCGWHFKSAWQAIRACWRTQTPVMVRGDSHLYTQRHPVKKVLKNFLYRSFIPKFDACLAVGQWSKEYYLHYGARPERIFLVPHVVDEELFGREFVHWLPRRTELRRQWRLPEERVVFMFSAKFIDRKRPADFVKAIAGAAKNGAPVAGFMVGDGPLRKECEALAQQYGAPISFSGFLNQKEIVRAYVAADALVLPSDGGETWGLVVNEAMSCERPCFVSDQVGCGPDLVHAGETGGTFPLGDVAALAQLLATQASDRTGLVRMGIRARARAREHSVAMAVEGVRQAIEVVAH